MCSTWNPLGFGISHIPTFEGTGEKKTRWVVLPLHVMYVSMKLGG